MSSAEQTRHRTKIDSKQRSPKPAAEKSSIASRQQTQLPAFPQPARMEQGALTPQSLLQLQRTIGNRAVNALLSKAQLPPIVQPKLLVGPAGDQYEQEADRVAQQVVSGLHSAATTSQPIQRQPEQEDDEVQLKPSSQRAGLAAGGAVTTDVESAIQQARGSGQALPDTVRAPLEQAFRTDFSGVRVHTDPQADQLNQSIQAVAFTTGQDVFFRRGAYDPESHSGQELLAHELTHVVQQTGVHEQAAQPNTQQGTPAGRSLLHSDKQLQAMWVKDVKEGYIWIDAEDTTGYIWTKEWHEKQDSHPAGYVYVKDDGEDKQEGLKKEDPVKLLYEVVELLKSNENIAATFMSMLSSKDLWSFAMTGKIPRQFAQTFCIVYLPRYEDRFVFNLATKGLLLIKPPSEKYGGKEESGKPHATSGYKWYQAALTGMGPIVLGDLKDYQTMRDYKQYLMSKEEAEDVERNAQYLMAWPWSLLVNAALVTGAIHGGRPVIGATKVTPEALYKEPDMKDTFGLSVYARELIQLVLKHEYQFAESSEGVTYPEPGLSGGNLLLPPEKSKKPATIFDVGEEEEMKYDSEKGAKTLVSELNAPEYKPIQYDTEVIKEVAKQKKTSAKQYKALRNRLKKLLELAKTKPMTPPKNIQEMIEEIYPAGIDKAAKPSIPNWQLREFDLALDSFEESLQ